MSNLKFILFKLDDSKFVNETIDKLLREYKKHVDSGLLDVIQPASAFYPNLDESVKRDFVYNDSVQRIRWRKKQIYDVSYLMNYAKERGIFYLHVIFFLDKININLFR